MDIFLQQHICSFVQEIQVKYLQGNESVKLSRLHFGFVQKKLLRRYLPGHLFVIESITWSVSYKCNQNATSLIKR